MLNHQFIDNFCNSVENRNPDMIALINNMRAKKNLTGLYCKKTLEGVLAPDSLIFDTNTLDELDEAIDTILEENVRILCINGGDGSLQKAVTKLLTKTKEGKELPFLVPMRGGTMNVVCKNIGTNGNPYSVCERLAEKYKRFKTGYDGLEFREYRPIRVRSNLIEGSEYAFNFTTGIAYRITKTFYQGDELSPQRAFNLITSIIGGFIFGLKSADCYFEHMPVKMEIDGKPYPYDKILIAVAASYPKLILWFSPFYESTKPKEREGFNFIAVSCDNWEIIKNLRALSRGMMKVEQGYNDIAENIRMEFAGGFTIDGEVYESKNSIQVELSAGPVLKFIRV